MATAQNRKYKLEREKKMYDIKISPRVEFFFTSTQQAKITTSLIFLRIYITLAVLLSSLDR